METIPTEYRDRFEKPSFAFVATVLPDGSLHVTLAWIDFDGEHVLVNTVRDNRKDRNVRRDPRVALAVPDPENPYRYLSVRGEVVERREESAREHLDELAERYTGQRKYPGPGGQERVVLVIRPRRRRRTVAALAERVTGPSRSRRRRSGGGLPELAVDPDDALPGVLRAAGPDPRDGPAVPALDGDGLAAREAEFAHRFAVDGRETAPLVLPFARFHSESHG